VRARLLFVPLPESGHCYGDVVLHDGASTGTRRWGERQYPVFNAMERLQPSPYLSYSAFLRCPGQPDAQALVDAEHTSVALVEDWAESIKVLCLRCSYGVPHEHGPEAKAGEWKVERSFGIAALDRQSAKALLERWVGGGQGREIEAVEHEEFPLTTPQPGLCWWRSPEGEA